MGPIHELVGSSIHHADDFNIAGRWKEPLEEIKHLPQNAAKSIGR
jgi:hypothetical protein